MKKVFEKVSGESWTVEPVDSRKTLEEASQKLKNGDFSAIPTLIGGALFGYQHFGDFRSYGLANEYLGLPKDDLEADVKAVWESL